MSTKTKTTQQVAEQAAAWFQTAERANGDKFDRLRDGAPEWITNAIREAHSGGEMLPDDYVYAFARQAFDYIAENDADEDAAHDFADSTTDVYTADLIAWMRSNLRRVGWCDEAVEELGGGEDVDTFKRMQYGQYEERRSVFATILAAVEAQQASEAAS